MWYCNVYRASPIFDTPGARHRDAIVSQAVFSGKALASSWCHFDLSQGQLVRSSQATVCIISGIFSNGALSYPQKQPSTNLRATDIFSRYPNTLAPEATIPPAKQLRFWGFGSILGCAMPSWSYHDTSPGRSASRPSLVMGRKKILCFIDAKALRYKVWYWCKAPPRRIYCYPSSTSETHNNNMARKSTNLREILIKRVHHSPHCRPRKFMRVWHLYTDHNKPQTGNFSMFLLLFKHFHYPRNCIKPSSILS